MPIHKRETKSSTVKKNFLIVINDSNMMFSVPTLGSLNDVKLVLNCD